MQSFNHFNSPNFNALLLTVGHQLVNASHRVEPTFWQGTDVSKRPEAVTYELMNVGLTVPLRGIDSLPHWRFDIKPNLPWADDHFEERVCGFPINPGVEWERWPWGGNAAKFLEKDGRFNHNYMERYWPQYAGRDAQVPTANVGDWYAVNPDEPDTNCGIRGAYGDLNNVVNLLLKDPLTRQAWMPVFFPEDTGDANLGRKPCTLGYQFIRREGKLHIYYPLRSCDFAKHFRDDIYLTVRLLLWVINQLKEKDPANWEFVEAGSYTMHATSLHVFANDMIELKKQYGVL